MQAKDNGWRIERCVCVADVGQVVNPAGVEAQLMGGTVDGLSTAIGLEITVENGRIEQSNFDGYPLLRMPDAPIGRNLRPAIDDDSPPARAKWAFRARRPRWPTRFSPRPASACAISR